MSFEMSFDRPWKVLLLIGLLAVLRSVWGAWKEAPKRKYLIEVLDSALIAVILVFVIIRPFVVQAFFIPSRSMEPTIVPGDRVLVNRFLYRLNPPQRGDVIVFDAPRYARQEHDVGQKDFIKRLVGLPGDSIAIRRGEGVFVNGEVLREASGVPKPDYDWPAAEWGSPPGAAYRVPAGCYFVLGDNRADSYDSHAWKDWDTGRAHPELPAERVLGKAMVKFWPPARIGLLNDHAQVCVPSDSKPWGAAAHAAR